MICLNIRKLRIEIRQFSMRLAIEFICFNSHDEGSFVLGMHKQSVNDAIRKNSKLLKQISILLW